MRHERTVIIKHPWLRRMRDDLRRLYRKHFFPVNFHPTAESEEILKKNSRIYRGSICECNSYTRINRNMIYNKPEGKWYCLECYQSMKAQNTKPSDWPLNRAEIRTFIKELAGPEGCQYDGRQWRSGGKEFTYARKILDSMGIPKDKQEDFLSLCRAFGGYCDCEILMNAVSSLLGEETLY